MKIASLSQSCASTSTPKYYSMSAKSVNNGANASKILSKADADRSLQRTYCLSSLSFLGCLALVYSIAAIFAGNTHAANSLSKIV